MDDRIITIEELVNYLKEDDEEPCDVTLSNFDDEKRIVEEFLKRYPVNENILKYYISSKFEPDGCYTIKLDGLKPTVDFQWVLN